MRWNVVKDGLEIRLFYPLTTYIMNRRRGKWGRGAGRVQRGWRGGYGGAGDSRDHGGQGRGQARWAHNYSISRDRPKIRTEFLVRLDIRLFCSVFGPEPDGSRFFADLVPDLKPGSRSIRSAILALQYLLIRRVPKNVNQFLKIKCTISSPLLSSPFFNNLFEVQIPCLIRFWRNLGKLGPWVETC